MVTSFVSDKFSISCEWLGEEVVLMALLLFLRLLSVVVRRLSRTAITLGLTEE